MALPRLYYRQNAPYPETFGQVPLHVLDPIESTIPPDSTKAFKFGVTASHDFDDASEGAGVPRPLVQMSSHILLHAVNRSLLYPIPSGFDRITTGFELVFRRGVQPDDEIEEWHTHPEIANATIAGLAAKGRQTEFLAGRVKAPLRGSSGYKETQSSSIVVFDASDSIPITALTSKLVHRRTPGYIDPNRLFFGFRVVLQKSL